MAVRCTVGPSWLWHHSSGSSCQKIWGLLPQCVIFIRVWRPISFAWHLGREVLHRNPSWLLCCFAFLICFFTATLLPLLWYLQYFSPCSPLPNPPAFPISLFPSFPPSLFAPSHAPFPFEGWLQLSFPPLYAVTAHILGPCHPECCTNSSPSHLHSYHHNTVLVVAPSPLPPSFFPTAPLSGDFGPCTWSQFMCSCCKCFFEKHAY